MLGIIAGLSPDTSPVFNYGAWAFVVIAFGLLIRSILKNDRRADNNNEKNLAVARADADRARQDLKEERERWDTRERQYIRTIESLQNRILGLSGAGEATSE